MSSQSLLRYGISLGLLLLILMNVDFDILLSETSLSSLQLLFPATLAIVGQIIFLNFRWHILLNAGRQKVSFRHSLFINIAGYFANILFITSVGGIIAKSGLAIKHGVSVMHSIFVTFLDRFMTLFALLAFTIISLPFLSSILDQQIASMLSACIIFIVLAVGVSLGILRSGFLKNYILSSRRRSRLIATVRHVLENPKLMGKTIAHSLIAQAFFILCVFILSLGIEYDGNVIQFLALLPVLSLISSLPISFGGWGVREGAFIYGLGLIGFSLESAFLLSVQVGLVTLIAPFFVGLPYLLDKDFKKFFPSKAKATK
ncbi:MAG: flippase-like domain-containing protein [Alphaproteobacteria bacterium]|nr:flippase-like domain-containing protein [Alphaproteobacteria bacterium]